jgi:hypothetical protein
MTEKTHKGGCHCGAVRFETKGAPKFVARCHCADCRRSTGGAFSTWVGFNADQVRWPAPPQTYESSKGVKRGFCSSCGTPVSYQGEKWAGEMHFLIGVFDDPSAFVPTGDAFGKEALAWCAPKAVDRE